jgi:hypothetical protein
MVRCEGIVVRCEEVEGVRSRPRYELACYFIEVADADRDLIEQYVTWRSLRRLPASPPAAPAKSAASRAKGTASPARSAAAGKARRRSASS